VEGDGLTKSNRLGWLQETTGLTGTAAECVEALFAFIRRSQERYMEQELNLLLPRDQIQDTRVTAVLYFLPTTKDLSDRDRDILAALGELVPTIPIMCKVCASCTLCAADGASHLQNSLHACIKAA
jgi:hypothetical protein